MTHHNSVSVLSRHCPHPFLLAHFSWLGGVIVSNISEGRVDSVLVWRLDWLAEIRRRLTAVKATATWSSNSSLGSSLMKESLQKHSHAKKEKERKKRTRAFPYNTQRLCHKRNYAHNFYLHVAIITVCLKITFSLSLSRLLSYFLFPMSGREVEYRLELVLRIFFFLENVIIRHTSPSCLSRMALVWSIFLSSSPLSMNQTSVLGRMWDWALAFNFLCVGLFSFLSLMQCLWTR